VGRARCRLKWHQHPPDRWEGQEDFGDDQARIGSVSHPAETGLLISSRKLASDPICLAVSCQLLISRVPDNWFRLTVVLRPLPNDRLQGFQADFSILLGASLADPDHAAAVRAGHLFVEDKFDDLAAPKIEISAQPEAFFRGIEDEAGEPLWFTVQIDDQAGAPLRHQTLRAAGFGDLKAGHSFNHWSTSSDGTPRLVSFEMRNDEPLASRGVPRASHS
jgi:hypothetical protein